MSCYKDRDRNKCDYTTYTHNYSCSATNGDIYRQVIVVSTVNNYRKGIFGWKPHETQCEFRNKSYTISAPVVTGHNGTHSTFVYDDLSVYSFEVSSTKKVATLTSTKYVGDRVHNVSIAYPYFKNFNGRATNQALGGLWASIICLGN